ncbi:DoxX family protein [Sphingomonas tabacisoli]|uniref:DoxX family protein n=1 Tax=Sphingomonas tabacisoli TaxID=2249466 RepID=A0ABW4I2Y4_9SPHN
MRIVQAAAALVLGAFFAFVGWMKTFAPVALLAEHHAWTVWLPESLGRIVGVSELGCAAALVVPIAFGRFAAVQRTSALILIVNQLVAAGFHAAHGEAGALPQNAVLIALLVFVAAAAPNRTNQRKGEDG